jgi:hypothetical protein
LKQERFNLRRRKPESHPASVNKSSHFLARRATSRATSDRRKSKPGARRKEGRLEPGDGNRVHPGTHPQLEELL